MDFGDLAGLDAARADAHRLDPAVDARAQRFQVGIEAAIGQVVGVRNVVSEDWALAANITSSRQFSYLQQNLDYHYTHSSRQCKSLVTLFSSP